MHVAQTRFRVLSMFLLGAELVAVVVFLVSRPPLDEGGWQFLERQRPIVKEGPDGMEREMFVVADGLNFALARRPIGGWESASVKVFQVVHFPAYLAALFTFHTLQETPGGTSKLHSDLATLVFGMVSIAQWLGLSLFLSARS